MSRNGRLLLQENVTFITNFVVLFTVVFFRVKVAVLPDYNILMIMYSVVQELLGSFTQVKVAVLPWF